MNMHLVNTVVEPLGWTLLHFIWQGLLIGLLHELALLAAARRSPQLRYGISLTALIATLVVPLVTFTLLALAPSSETPVHQAATASPSAAQAVLAPAATTDSGFLHSLEYLLPYIVALWLFGVSALSIRFGIGLYSLRRLAANADFSAVSDWMREELERLAKRMAISRPVRIALSTRVNSPLVVGWLKPVIFLPLSAATGLDHNQIRMVLAHELAHLRRHDHFVNFLQVIVETVLFYHPAVHRISRSLRQEREQCCDDMAASLSGNALAYARVLAQLEEMRQKERTHVLALGIAEQELYFRIQRLVGTPSRTSPDRWLPLMVIGLLATFAVSRAPDIDAPLLPEFRDASSQRQRVALELPAFTPRAAFRPIRDTSNSGAGKTAPAPTTPVVVPRTEKSKTASALNTGDDSVPLPSKVTSQAAVSRTESREAATRVTAARLQPLKKVPVAEDATTTERAREKAAEISPPVTSGGELIHAEKPAYPRRALRQGEEGHVLLEFTITADGKVIDPAVIKASPRGRFEAAALQAIREWRYQPFTQNGEPVARRASQVLEFRLAEPARNAGTSGASECKEQTGSRLCRAVQTDDTRLQVLKN